MDMTERAQIHTSGKVLTIFSPNLCRTTCTRLDAAFPGSPCRLPHTHRQWWEGASLERKHLNRHLCPRGGLQEGAAGGGWGLETSAGGVGPSPACEQKGSLWSQQASKHAGPPATGIFPFKQHGGPLPGCEQGWNMTLLRFQASSLGTSEGTRSQGAKKTAEMRGLGGRGGEAAWSEEIKEGEPRGCPVIGAEDTRDP